MDGPVGVLLTSTPVLWVGSGTILFSSSTLVVPGSVHSVVRTPSSCTVGAAAAPAGATTAIAASARNGTSHRSLRFIEIPLRRGLDKQSTRARRNCRRLSSSCQVSVERVYTL